MAASQYHFLTRWKIHGPIERVFEILRDGRRYDDWWRPAYRLSEQAGPRKVRVIVRARLPYRLTFSTEIVREKPPHEIEIRADGDLVGRGLWQLSDQTSAEGHPITDVIFTWEVQAQKPLVRWLSPLLRPIFEWNHDWVMKTGEACLQAEIDRRSLK